MKKINYKQKGFTLLEVTSMVVIVAIIITATLVTFTKVRQKNRNIMRISDITQLQNALASYYRDNNAYPAAITANQVLMAGGITYITTVPGNRAPYSDGDCPGLSDYVYTQDNSGASYHLRFCLGVPASNLTAGTHYATPVGIY